MKKKFQAALFMALALGIGIAGRGTAEADSQVIVAGAAIEDEDAVESVDEVNAALEAETVCIEDAEVPLYDKPAAGHVRTPQASGIVTYGNSRVTIDASNIGQGYVMVKYNGGAGRIKVQVTKNNVTYTYDLNARDRVVSYDCYAYNSW